MSLYSKYEEKIISQISGIYERYGYAQYRMNKFEEYDLYVKNKDFLVSDGVITFTDTNGKLMALKPDVTLSIIKNGKDKPNYVQKVFYNESVYRISKSTHSFKEITQVGLECIGAVDDYTIYETLFLAAESLSKISDEYIIDISNLNIVEKVIKLLNISEEGGREILKCIGEKNIHRIKELCTNESISDELSNMALQLVLCSGEPTEAINKLKSFKFANEFQNEINQLENIIIMLQKSGHKNKIHIDFSVINDMSYYSGIVFNGFVNGVPNSVLSGGQYDRLVRKMNRKSGAIGFAVYIDMLERLQHDNNDCDTDVVVIYDSTTNMQQLCDKVAKITADNKRVMVQKTLPENITYKQIIELNRSEGENR